jgi:hypothetical protein
MSRFSQGGLHPDTDNSFDGASGFGTGYSAGWSASFGSFPDATQAQAFNAAIRAAKPGGGGGGGVTPPSSYTSGGPAATSYNIKITFGGTGWTQPLINAVERAADKISSIITGDVSNVTYLGQKIDDIAIKVSIGAIDGLGSGAGDVVAQTQVLSYRDAGDVGTHTNELYMPVTAAMTLDTADVKVSGGNINAWDDIVLHEMLHAAGFAQPIFALKGLIGPNLDNGGLSDVFLGGHAISAYLGNDLQLTASPALLQAGGIPLQPLDDSHWDEYNFKAAMTSDLTSIGLTGSNELMTATFTSQTETTWLSDVTVGGLKDLGYSVTDPSPASAGWVVKLF